jgi:hypothetical protein
MCHMKYGYLELSASASNADGGLVAHYLSCDHSHSLALRGIDLTRHDTAARFVLGENQFTEATARTRAKESNVISDLHQRASDDIQSTMSFGKGVVTS